MRKDIRILWASVFFILIVYISLMSYTIIHFINSKL